jgi:hypothetical protein
MPSPCTARSPSHSPSTSRPAAVAKESTSPATRVLVNSSGPTIAAIDPSTTPVRTGPTIRRMARNSHTPPKAQISMAIPVRSGIPKNDGSGKTRDTSKASNPRNRKTSWRLRRSCHQSAAPMATPNRDDTIAPPRPSSPAISPMKMVTATDQASAPPNHRTLRIRRPRSAG